MTKLISILIVVVVIYIGYAVFKYWEEVSNEEYEARKNAVPTQVIPEQLPGMPTQQLETTLQEAQKAGPAAMRDWLKRYEKVVQDPRLAWIELDYVVMVSRDDPAEAKRVFAKVKDRTPSSSPVYPRVKQLEKTYK